MAEPKSASWMPSHAAAQLCRQLQSLLPMQLLTPAVFEQIVRYCGVRPGRQAWRLFLSRVLLLAGSLAIICGVIFFFAWNWAAMPVMAKFGVIELLIVALAILIWWRWYDAVSRTALLAAGFFFGALFAVFGQIYQTGADSWELFRAWTLVLIPLALIGRQVGLWFLTWLVANIGLNLFFYSYSSRFTTSFSLLDSAFYVNTFLTYGYLLFQGLCLLTWEATERFGKTKSPDKTTNHWFPRIMAAYFLLSLTMPVIEEIIDFSFRQHGYVFLLCWLVVMAGGYGWYRYRQPDLCMLTFGICSLLAVGTAVIVTSVSWSGDIGSLFLIGIAIALLFGAGGKLLLHWRRQMYPNQAVELSQSEYDELLLALEQRALIDENQKAELLGEQGKLTLPWYIRAAFALGGWVAALILLGLLILLGFVSGILDDLKAGTIIVFSLMGGALAAWLLSLPSLGRQQIGLVWAIASSIGLCIGITIIQDSSSRSMLVQSLWFIPVLAVLIVVFRNDMYRLLATGTLVFMSIVVTSYALIWHLAPDNQWLIFLTPIVIVTAIVMLILWLICNEVRLLATPNAPLIHPLMYGGIGGLLVVCLHSIQMGNAHEFYWMSDTGPYLEHSLGYGIPAAFLLFTLIQWALHRGEFKPLWLIAAVVTSLVAHFAPGIGFGLALLLIARYQGNQWLLGVAASFLAVYTSGWYYFLGFSLLYKSLLLIGCGVLLLVLAGVLNRMLSAGEVNQNA
ncbi:DUF4401 domain-containing protein [Edaphovirga cremea]|uniref:DUF4401 domain-containing protein n=1 Tax=Edaphovirga cremea TaxID=2267246 RepID=UPI000DEFABE1|nr:DUF4401 domain-containing protein [Edaphovirga cremea]